MTQNSTPLQEKELTKSGMTIRWHFKGERIFFEMDAPAKGWLAIGFNDTQQLKGTYLIMGSVSGNGPKVVEHYTRSPGDYLPITALGDVIEVSDVWGKQTESQTTIGFSLPTTAKSEFKKQLRPGERFHLLLAYSRSDDFQHHSIMRTALTITL